MVAHKTRVKAFDSKCHIKSRLNALMSHYIECNIKYM